MRNKLAAIFVVILFSVSYLFGGSFSEASSKLSELEQQQKDLEEQNSNLESEKEETEKQLQELEQEVDNLNAEVKQLDNEIMSTEQKINETSQSIEETSADIENLKQEIDKQIERIKERDALLADRARALQKSGGTISYLEVLLGAQSFSDFVTRVSAVSMVVEADKSIIEQHKKDKEVLEENKTELEEQMASLEQLKNQLEEQMASLERKKDEKADLLAELNAKIESTEEFIFSLEEKQKVIEDQKAAVAKAIELEKKRIEEEKRRQQEQQQQNPGSTPPPAGNSTFIRPAAGVVTSEFGGRIHPIYGIWKQHNGIDIANSYNTPIYAVASGVVATTSYHNARGYYVVINHYINGQVYSTVYQHLTSYAVSPGQVVEQGQYIGGMGSTGDSTGVHLHFEIYEGIFENGGIPVNPRKYINF